MVQRKKAKGNNDTMAQPGDAIAMLKADHRKVRSLFLQYKATHDPHMKQRIAAQVFAELALTAQLEETVFYPAFAAEADEEGDCLVGGALQAHQLFKDLIAELRDIDDDDEFEARFQELMDHVEQHVEEEEREMFPKAEEQLKERREDLRDEMQALKDQRVAS